MPLEVFMPQMGESITEGTLVRWLKKPGETVKRDEPLFEISTDKVDTEIPSPGDGVLSEIKVKEGQTVPVNTVVCLLSGAGGEKSPAPAAGKAATPPAKPASVPPIKPVAAAQSPSVLPTSDLRLPTSPQPPASTPGRQQSPPAHISEADDDAGGQRSSPLVRKIAQEHGVDISRLTGSGAGGRVTKKDILDYIQAGGDAGSPGSAAASAPSAPSAPVSAAPAPAPAAAAGDRARIEPMSIMRSKIAEHMVLSRNTSVHVTTVHEVDLTEVSKIREARKEAFQRESGVKLTFLAFIAKAAVDALKGFPVINASVVGKDIHYHRGVNLGIAVALPDGLIVPVIQGADEKNILGLARAVQDLADRARARRLSPAEVQGGTFTISNYGSNGAVIATPIINQPQVAILGIGAAVKRPAVLPGTESIAIRTISYLSLSFDHRLIDGAIADQYLSQVKEILEKGAFALS